MVLHSPGCEASLEEGAFTYCRISRQIPPLLLLSLSPPLFSSLIFIQSKTQLDSLSQRLLEVTPLTPSLTLTHPPEKLFAQPSRRCITRCSRLMPHTHSARLSPERIGAKAPKFCFQNTWRCNGWQRVASQRLNLLIESRHACCFESACERRCRRNLILIASRD